MNRHIKFGVKAVTTFVIILGWAALSLALFAYPLGTPGLPIRVKAAWMLLGLLNLVAACSAISYCCDGKKL